MEADVVPRFAHDARIGVSCDKTWVHHQAQDLVRSSNGRCNACTWLRKCMKRAEYGVCYIFLGAFLLMNGKKVG